MPFDLTLPKDGATTFGELYSVLRDNFNFLYDKHIQTAWNWVNSGLGTNWVIGGSGFIGYMKNPFGFVYLRGYVYASGTASTTIWTLPVGYRPGYTRKFICGYPYTFSGTDYRPYITINSSGVITASNEVDKAYSFDTNVSFMPGD
jgi:hypothetical protein